MISAAATKQRSKTMSPMIETTAVGWLTLAPPPAPIDVDDDRADRAEDRVRTRSPPAPPTSPRSGCRRGRLAGRGHLAVGGYGAPSRPGDRRPPQLVEAPDRPHAGDARAVARRGRSAPARSRPPARRRRPRTASRRRAPHRAARAPASDSACSKIAGDGLAAPIAAELTAPSSNGASPVRSSTSSTDTSQLETTTIRTPRARTASSASRASSKATNRSEASSARQQLVEVERVRTPAGSASRSTAAQRSRSCAQRLGVAAVAHVRAVERDLGAQRGARPRASETSTPNRSRSSERSSGAGGSQRARASPSRRSAAPVGDGARGDGCGGVRACSSSDGALTSVERTVRASARDRAPSRSADPASRNPAPVTLGCGSTRLGRLMSSRPLARAQPHLTMSRRERQRRRRKSRGFPLGRVIGVGVLLVVCAVAIGAAAAAGWVLNVAHSAPNLSKKPTINPGSPSQVFASDGSSLGYIYSPDVSVKLTLRDVPKRGAPGDDRDRGPPLLPARRARLRGHHPRRDQGHRARLDRAAGRLDADRAGRRQRVPAQEHRQGPQARNLKYKIEQAKLAEQLESRSTPRTGS